MKTSAVVDVARELNWERVGARLDEWLELGRSRLPPAGKTLPRELHLELTHRCNLKCVMCEHWQVEHLDPASVKRELDFAGIRSAVEGAAVLAEVEYAVITGGEPWLRHDLVDILVWLAGALPKARFIVLTNFWNTGHLRLKLGELKAAGLFGGGKPSRLSLGSSLDGLEEIHDEVRGQPGAFSGLVRTVRAVKAEFPEVDFGFTYTMVPRNAAQLYETYRFVTRDLGVSFGAQWAVQTAGIEPLGWTPSAREAGLAGVRRIAAEICALNDAARKLDAPDRREHLGLWSNLVYWRYLEQYGREERRFPFFLRCTAGERHLMIGAEGEAFFCPVNRARTIGSVKEQGLDAMWTSPKAESERAFVASGACHCWLRCVSAPAADRLLALALA
ncbi:MAG: radical SAM protein [Elusimicrobiota bacterium]|nr:radical SAM protein [Elusimicrobiota bacterium]